MQEFVSAILSRALHVDAASRPRAVARDTNTLSSGLTAAHPESKRLSAVFSVDPGAYSAYIASCLAPVLLQPLLCLIIFPLADFPSVTTSVRGLFRDESPVLKITTHPLFGVRQMG